MVSVGSEEQDRRCEDADGDDVDRAREDKEERGAASRHELADEAQPSDLGELPAARLEAAHGLRSIVLPGFPSPAVDIRPNIGSKCKQ